MAVQQTLQLQENKMNYLVKVKPGSKQNSVEISGNEIILRTTARAHDGEANESVIKLLSKHFKVAKGQIKIIRGEKSKEKIIEII